MECLSDQQLKTRVNEERIDMLQNMIQDSARTMGRHEVFSHKPAKVFDVLARLPSKDSAKDLLHMRAELCAS